MPVNVKESDNFFRRLRQWVGHFLSKFHPKLWISFFVQNAKFRDFVRFSSKTNFLCPYSFGFSRVHECDRHTYRWVSEWKDKDVEGMEDTEWKGREGGGTRKKKERIDPPLQNPMYVNERLSAIFKVSNHPPHQQIVKNKYERYYGHRSACNSCNSWPLYAC